MDYKRIYAAFIKSRLANLPNEDDYYEVHHILPRSLGGGDEPENLIRLTPEDHFFAHLLLAKIHGGRLWAPVAFMVGGSRKDYRPIISRGNYDWARRAMARAISGENAHQFDGTLYLLAHKSGRHWRGTQFEMSESLGLTKPLANMLVKGRVKSARGWRLAHMDETEVGRKGGSQHPMYREERYRFRHVDGREFYGTQYEFHRACGVSKSQACMLARGKRSVTDGWYIEGRSLPTTGRGARWSKQIIESRAQYSLV